jgi:hypothetical protein
LASEGIHVEKTAQSHRPAAYRSRASRASLGERSALLPSPNRVRKTADNRSCANYIHLHIQAVPIPSAMRIASQPDTNDPIRHANDLAGARQ